MKQVRFKPWFKCLFLRLKAKLCKLKRDLLEPSGGGQQNFTTSEVSRSWSPNVNMSALTCADCPEWTNETNDGTPEIQLHMWNMRIILCLMCRRWEVCRIWGSLSGSISCSLFMQDDDWRLELCCTASASPCWHHVYQHHLPSTNIPCTMWASRACHLHPQPLHHGRLAEWSQVQKIGDARIGLVGFPSVGKSSLLTALTGVQLGTRKGNQRRKEHYMIQSNISEWTQLQHVHSHRNCMSLYHLLTSAAWEGSLFDPLEGFF